MKDVILFLFIQTIKKITSSNLEMHKKSLNGSFVIQKPQCTFSRKPNDKAHEQNVKVIKESKGAIGKFDQVICLAKWKIARVFINLGDKICP